MVDSMSKPETITVTTNHWYIPDVSKAFDLWLEGDASPQERKDVIEKTLADRAKWKPTKEGMALFEALKVFIGWKVKIEFWDSEMVVFPEEAPFPIVADCHGLVLHEVDGFTQAFIQISNPVQLPTPEGYSSASFLMQSPDGQFLLAPLNGLYRIGSVGSADDQRSSISEGS